NFNHAQNAPTNEIYKNIWNLKNGWIRTHTNFIFDLAIFLGYESISSVSDILERLRKENVLNHCFIDVLRISWQKVNLLRWNKQIAFEGFPDSHDPNEVFFKGVDPSRYEPHMRFRLPVLSDEDVNDLNNITQFTLEPALQTLKKMFESEMIV